ncbi:MAG: hypothetical protein GY842_14480 [bacterium]|nr:hypothetical protein [bacterium]
MVKNLMVLLAGLAVCAFVGASGCQNQQAPSGATTQTDDDFSEVADVNFNGDPTDTPDDVTTDGLADSNGAADTNGLTAEQEDAVNSAVAMIDRLAGLFAALAAGDLSSLASGDFTLDPTKTCPSISYEEGLFVVDYGDGCNPILYPESTFSGIMYVDMDLAERTFTITFEEFTLYEGQTTTGTIETTVTLEDDVLTFEAYVDVVHVGEDDEGQPYQVHDVGDVTVEVDLSTGEIFIPLADMSTTDQTGEVYAVILEDVHIDWYEVLPDSGKCTLVLGDEGIDQVIMEITFTDDTPVNGTVIVSVNGSRPVTMSLDGIEV